VQPECMSQLYKTKGTAPARSGNSLDWDTVLGGSTQVQILGVLTKKYAQRDIRLVA
jgi:hypothetical protein